MITGVNPGEVALTLNSIVASSTKSNDQRSQRYPSTLPSFWVFQSRMPRVTICISGTFKSGVRMGTVTPFLV
ncbi:MAG: hypothetical protein DYG85_10505 [Chloroflexi bacterium CFX1]|nr:hypothetical protein [Chloroflexi bacterium CFX1]